MEYEPDDDNIAQFWEWFEINESWIRDILNDDDHRDKEELVQTLNNKVLQFGMFSWEMGRGRRRPYFLTISPNRDPELLNLSRHIMDYAPDLSGWEFNAAKPAEEWDLHFSLWDDDLNQWEVNASSWKFILMPGPANKVNVLIEAKNISQLDDDTQKNAGDTVVTTLLGEAMRIDHIDRVEVVSEFKQQQKKEAAPIQELKPLVEEYLDLPYE